MRVQAPLCAAIAAFSVILTAPASAEDARECAGATLARVSSTNFIHRGGELVVDCATLITPEFKCSVRRRGSDGGWTYGESTNADVCAAFEAAIEKIEQTQKK